MPNFAMTLVHGPSWDISCGTREQQGWDEHAAFMDALVESGFILLGGPVGDRRQTLHVVEAADEGEVRRRIAQDPWAQARLLEVGSIQPWALWLDFRSTDSST
ncbi:MAG: YciI family protein [Candidatus Dormibacteria bacterium]